MPWATSHFKKERSSEQSPPDSTFPVTCYVSWLHKLATKLTRCLIARETVNGRGLSGAHHICGGGQSCVDSQDDCCIIMVAEMGIPVVVVHKVPIAGWHTPDSADCKMDDRLPLVLGKRGRRALLDLPLSLGKLKTITYLNKSLLFFLGNFPPLPFALLGQQPTRVYHQAQAFALPHKLKFNPSPTYFPPPHIAPLLSQPNKNPFPNY